MDLTKLRNKQPANPQTKQNQPANQEPKNQTKQRNNTQGMNHGNYRIYASIITHRRSSAGYPRVLHRTSPARAGNQQLAQCTATIHATPLKAFIEDKANITDKIKKILNQQVNQWKDLHNQNTHKY